MKLQFFSGSTTEHQLPEYADLYNRSMLFLHAGDFMVEPMEDWRDLLPSMVIECRDFDHHLCGVALLKTPDMEGEKSSNLTLVVLAVDPDYQGCGIGKLLIQQSFRLAGELRLSRLKGYVREDSSSIAFYQRMGFVFDSDRTHFSPEDVPMIPFSSKTRKVLDATPPLLKLEPLAASPQVQTRSPFDPN